MGNSEQAAGVLLMAGALLVLYLYNTGKLPKLVSATTEKPLAAAGEVTTVHNPDGSITFTPPSGKQIEPSSSPIEQGPNGEITVWPAPGTVPINPGTGTGTLPPYLPPYPVGRN